LGENRALADQVEISRLCSFNVNAELLCKCLIFDDPVLIVKKMILVLLVHLSKVLHFLELVDVLLIFSSAIRHNMQVIEVALCT
jgi:hypothetical protein